ncbi:hypothetical protein SAMN05421858_3020 [Haladaptatus litoreus]|uniref:Uncharacterized protein n=1 Tax=Haladaptatus litoreus TaxID=553468 RepID=A0A1N7CI59_9EURY|nr:hypothetical protein SAMN05421858_3020 [Haladaptatus litoreus]
MCVLAFPKAVGYYLNCGMTMVTLAFGIGGDTGRQDRR